MKNKLILLFALGLCTQVQAQAPHLSREAYRDRVEAYSQVLKQQHLKSMASTDARKIAFTGFLLGRTGRTIPQPHLSRGIRRVAATLYRRCPASPKPYSPS